MAYIDDLIARLRSVSRSTSRADGPVIVGMTGAPGVGKSTLAQLLISELRSTGEVAVHVPMDGFHLSNRQLLLLGIQSRKGSAETFDAYGYIALLRRMRIERGHTVFAPSYDRQIEEPVAGSIAVSAETQYIITEGNYLLVPASPWNEVCNELDEVWFLDLPAEVRRSRLCTRHIQFGKTEEEAERWVASVDEPNAEKINETRRAADYIVDVSRVEIFPLLEG